MSDVKPKHEDTLAQEIRNAYETVMENLAANLPFMPVTRGELALKATFTTAFTIQAADTPERLRKRLPDPRKFWLQHSVMTGLGGRIITSSRLGYTVFSSAGRLPPRGTFIDFEAIVRFDFSRDLTTPQLFYKTAEVFSQDPRHKLGILEHRYRWHFILQGEG
ncbi:MAG: hypothetical protein WAX89_06210, partial [Alphaproteobacteria bacterium]